MRFNPGISDNHRVGDDVDQLFLFPDGKGLRNIRHHIPDALFGIVAGIHFHTALDAVFSQYGIDQRRLAGTGTAEYQNKVPFFNLKMDVLQQLFLFG